MVTLHHLGPLSRWVRVESAYVFLFSWTDRLAGGVGRFPRSSPSKFSCFIKSWQAFSNESRDSLSFWVRDLHVNLTGSIITVPFWKLRWIIVSDTSPKLSLYTYKFFFLDSSYSALFEEFFDVKGSVEKSFCLHF